MYQFTRFVITILMTYIKTSLESLSIIYTTVMFERFQRNLQLGPNGAKRRQSLGRLYASLLQKFRNCSLGKIYGNASSCFSMSRSHVLTHFFPPLRSTFQHHCVQLRDDSALRALSSLRGLRGAPEVPPLCRETQSLGPQMLERWA